MKVYSYLKFHKGEHFLPSVKSTVRRLANIGKFWLYYYTTRFIGTQREALGLKLRRFESLIFKKEA